MKHRHAGGRARHRPSLPIQALPGPLQEPRFWSQGDQDSNGSSTRFCETVGRPLDCSKKWRR